MTATGSHARAEAPALPPILPALAFGRNLSPALAPVLEPAPTAPAAGLRRLRAQLDAARDRHDASEPLTLAEVSALARAAVLDARPGLRVVAPEAGTGKTHGALTALPPLARAVVAEPTHAKADEVQRDLEALGATVERRRGVLSVLRPDGTPECRLYATARAVEDAGGSVPALLCRYCPHGRTCQARRPARRGGVIVTTHAMLPAVLRGTPDPGPVVVDETPDLFRSAVVTRADLDATAELLATDAHYKTLTRNYRALLAPLLGALRHALATGLPLAPAAAAYAETTEGRAARAGAYAVPATFRAPDTPAGVPHRLPPRATGDALADACALAAHATHADAPTLTAATPAARQRLHELDATRLARATLALRVLAAVRAVARAPAQCVLADDAVYVRTLSACAEVLATYPRLVLLDATPPHAALRALRPAVEFLEPAVVPAAPAAASRTVVYRADMHRRALAPNHTPDWSRLVPIVRHELAALRHAGVRQLLLVTFKCIAQALRAPGNPCAALLDAWRAEGRELDVRWYGTLEGLNRWADWDGCVTIGDPWPDLGAARHSAALLGLDPAAAGQALIAHTAGKLDQVQSRLRPVRRTTPVVQRHVGSVAPGRWCSATTRIETVPRGRPATPAADAGARAELCAFIGAVGGPTRAAQALGLTRMTLHRYVTGQRAIPAAVLAPLRARSSQEKPCNLAPLRAQGPPEGPRNRNPLQILNASLGDFGYAPPPWADPAPTAPSVAPALAGGVAGWHGS